jgi:hypothetical protein
MAEWHAAALLAVGGAALVAQTLPAYLRARQSQGWPRARGVVERAELVGPTGELWMRGGPAWGAAAAVRYRYEVGGELFTGYRLRYGAAPLWEIRRVAAQAEQGAIEVAYDPSDPGESVLLPGPSPLATRAVLGSATLLAVGLWWLARAVA